MERAIERKDRKRKEEKRERGQEREKKMHQDIDNTAPQARKEINNIIEESLLIKTPSPSNQLLTHSALSSDLFSIKNQDQHL